MCTKRNKLNLTIIFTVFIMIFGFLIIPHPRIVRADEKIKVSINTDHTKNNNKPEKEYGENKFSFTLKPGYQLKGCTGIDSSGNVTFLKGVKPITYEKDGKIIAVNVNGIDSKENTGDSLVTAGDSDITATLAAEDIDNGTKYTLQFRSGIGQDSAYEFVVHTESTKKTVSLTGVSENYIDGLNDGQFTYNVIKGISLLVPSKKGYKFTGWTITDTAGDPIIGEKQSDGTVAKLTTLLPTNGEGLILPCRENGYVFRVNGKDYAFADYDNIDKIHIEASWEAITNTLSFDMTQFEDDPQPVNRYAPYGETYLPENFGSDENPSTKTFTISSNEITFPVLSVSSNGYEFKGWKCEELFGNKDPHKVLEDIAENSKIVYPDNGRTYSLTPVWEKRNFTIKFDAEHGLDKNSEQSVEGSFNGKPAYTGSLDYKSEFTSNFQFPSDPTAAGYKFLGWKADGQADYVTENNFWSLVPTNVIPESGVRTITLHAVFKRVYTITLNTEDKWTFTDTTALSAQGITVKKDNGNYILEFTEDDLKNKNNGKVPESITIPAPTMNGDYIYLYVSGWKTDNNIEYKTEQGTLKINTGSIIDSNLSEVNFTAETSNRTFKVKYWVNNKVISDDETSIGAKYQYFNMPKITIDVNGGTGNNGKYEPTGDNRTIWKLKNGDKVYKKDFITDGYYDNTNYIDLRVTKNYKTETIAIIKDFVDKDGSFNFYLDRYPKIEATAGQYEKVVGNVTYPFIGYSYSPSSEGIFAKVGDGPKDIDFNSGSKTIYCIYSDKAETYTVTFQDENGKKISENSIYKGGTIGTFPSAEKAGYTLTWTDENGKSVSSTTKVTAGMTVKAVYTAKTYTVNFVNGSTTPKTVQFGNTLGSDMPADPTTDKNSEFKGWFAGDIQIKADTRFDESVIAKADKNNVITANAVFEEKKKEIKGFGMDDTFGVTNNNSSFTNQTGTWYIPLSIYESVYPGTSFYKAYAKAGHGEAFGGACAGFSTTAILLYMGENFPEATTDISKQKWLYFDNYKGDAENSIKDNVNTVNDFLTGLSSRYSSGKPMISYDGSSNSELGRLILSYQLYSQGYTAISKISDALRNEYYYTDKRNVHNPNGSYVKEALDMIQEARKEKKPLLFDFWWDYNNKMAGHAMVIRTDVDVEDEGNGWYKVYVYDSNYPRMSENMKDLCNSSGKGIGYYNTYTKKGRYEQYIELNPKENAWRSTEYAAGTDHKDGAVNDYFILVDTDTVFAHGDFDHNKYTYEEYYRGVYGDDYDWFVDNYGDKYGLTHASTNAEIYDENGELLAEIENGNPKNLSEDVYYQANLGLSDEPAGGTLVLPKGKITVKSTSANSLFTVNDPDNVVLMETGDGVEYTIDLENDNVSATSNNENEILARFANVTRDGMATYVETTYTMDKDTHMKLGLDDDNRIIAETDGREMLVETFGMDDKTVTAEDTNMTKEILEADGVTYTVEYTASTSYNGMKHVWENTKSSSKAVNDITVKVTSSSGEVSDYTVKTYKNKSAGEAYFKLKFKDKTLKKLFKKKKFGFTIRALMLTADNTEPVMNGKGTKVRYLKVQTPSGEMRIGKKNFFATVENGKILVTGCGNCYGAFEK